MYRIVIQALADDGVRALGERQVTLFRDAQPTLERLDRLTAMGIAAIAERLEGDGWSWVPEDELAALADADEGAWRTTS